MGEKRDVIIVGAGTAGCVLAGLLTASGKLRVLLVEAGGPPDSKFVSIPAAFAKLFKSELDWDLETEPQQAVGNRRIYTPRGKMLGGSSNMNAMMHQWCHPADFQEWQEQGAEGWGWEQVAPVFRDQERWLGEDPDGERGRQGPMIVSPNRNTRPLSHLFVQAARRAGLPGGEGYNGKAYQGAWIAELAQYKGKRFSAFHAYLKPALQRENLEVLSGAQVTRIHLAEGAVTGVRVERDGAAQDLSAPAVVLAAGAYGSPQLLMLSGIGPGQELSRLGLPVHVDSSQVGRNLQEHPVLPMIFRTPSRDTLKSAESPLNLLRYLLLKRGMLASNGVEGFAFTQVGPGPSEAPDLELLFLPFEHRKDLLEPPGEHAFGLGPAVVAPKSRGTVRLKSPDPLQPPAIDPALLSDPEGIDKAVLLEGVRLSRKIAATPPLAKENAGEIRPGSHIESESDLLAYAGEQLQTVYHPTSTCRMGADDRAVVSPQLRLKGADGLWVADASVMPSVPRGHPNAVVAMIARRAASWIGSALLDGAR